MDPGYEIEPAPIGHPNHHRLSVATAAAAILLAVVVAKPWAGADTTLPEGRVEPSTLISSARPARAELRVAPAEATPTWPAAASASDLAAASASEAEGALGALSARSGSWGVGTAGVGPRILREEAWTDWAPVVPETAGDTPANIAIWPHTGLCTGYPTINDRPSLVAVTAPRDLVPDWRLVGWWTDGGNVANLEGSIRQVSPAGNRGISYLERTDRAPWPLGRYEFHVIAGSSTVELTVCITRRD
jgi:hypothetical protein